MKHLLAFVLLLVLSMPAAAVTYQLIAQSYDAQRDQTICTYQASTGETAVRIYYGRYSCPRVM